MSQRPVRAIVVWGFPANLHARELHNFLWALPEYHDSWIVVENQHPIGFARFNTSEAAENAVRRVHYFEFDDNVKLRSELTDRDPQYGEFVSMQGVFSPPSSSNGQVIRGASPIGSRKRPLELPAEKTNKIFVGKLTSSSDKDEIQEELSRSEGFLKMRIAKREHQIMVFAEYETAELANEAVGFFSDGFVIPSSNVKGVVELARDFKRNVRNFPQRNFQ